MYIQPFSTINIENQTTIFYMISKNYTYKQKPNRVNVFIESFERSRLPSTQIIEQQSVLDLLHSDSKNMASNSDSSISSIHLLSSRLAWKINEKNSMPTQQKTRVDKGTHYFNKYDSPSLTPSKLSQYYQDY